MPSTASSSTDRSPRQQHIMAFPERPGHNSKEWLRLAPSSKPRNERIRKVSNDDLLEAFEAWKLTGKCPYLAERRDQLEKLVEEQEITQNDPETTPEEGLALQNKINQLKDEGSAVSWWLRMSNAERISICRVFDRENGPNGHSMEKGLLERLSKVEKVEVRSDPAILREFQELFEN